MCRFIRTKSEHGVKDAISALRGRLYRIGGPFRRDLPLVILCLCSLCPILTISRE